MALPTSFLTETLLFQLEEREVIKFPKAHRLPEFYPWSLERGKEREESLIWPVLAQALAQKPELWEETAGDSRGSALSIFTVTAAEQRALSFEVAQWVPGLATKPGD